MTVVHSDMHAHVNSS